MKNSQVRFLLLGLGVLVVVFRPLTALGRSYGLDVRAASPPFLGHPEIEHGEFPSRLSQTGAFQDTVRMVPADGLIPYRLNVPFFSDDAIKTRWISVPSSETIPVSTISFSPTGEWKFPTGTVFVKHFDFGTDETHPEVRRRLETRLVAVDRRGGVQVATYKWRPDGSDADLLTTSLAEPIVIRTSSGERTQTWNYPGSQDCRTCHTELNGGVLGVTARQLNGPFTYPTGRDDNQLRTWSHLGLFDHALDEASLASIPALVSASERSRPIEDRARSYLDANCSHCHRPGGTVGNFDARFNTPLSAQNLIDGAVLIDQGIDRARVIAPRDIWRSILYLRPSTLEGMKMPPIAHERLDQAGLALLRDWINSLPGIPALAPPEISSTAVTPDGQAEVTVRHPEPDVKIRYTTDGSAPGQSDPIYQGPIRVSLPTVVRARAYKSGFTRSIAAQQFFQASN